MLVPDAKVPPAWIVTLPAMPPRPFNVAPEATDVVVLASNPLTINVPPETVVLPTYVLLPESVSVPVVQLEAVAQVESVAPPD